MRATPHALNVRLLGKHQAAALFATVVDFASMIALVEFAHLKPAHATFVSAIVGGVANFAASRFWAYRSLHVGSVHAQAFRYALVSLGSAALNAFFVGLALHFVRAPYVLVRAVVAIFVSVFYNYWMHARFVFRLRTRDPAVGPPSSEESPW